jgi:predicted nucleic acid-binding Zn ribbon protein
LKPKLPPPDECANCGATLPRTARACPECGADERTGWRDDESTRYDGLDLPESAFEDGTERPKPRRLMILGLSWYWWLVAALLAAWLIRRQLP